MPRYTIDKTCVFFRQSTLPARWMIGMSLMGVTVTLTGSRRYPYSVELSESDFLSALALIEEL